MDRSACFTLASISLALLAASCSTPDVPPSTKEAAPVIARADFSGPEGAQPKAPAASEPDPPERSIPEPAPPIAAPTTPTPWGSPLQITGKSHGLRWTTTAQVERTATTLQLALDIALHNSTRAPMNVSLHPPLASVMTTPAPGTDGTGMGLGLRGEGMGSDVCSPGHGGPTRLPPGGRASVQRKLVELDPLPWPPGQAYRVTASAHDCRPGRLVLDVLDVTIIQPASPDGVPTLVPVEAPLAK
jgi:hypothetical protein